MLKPSEELWKKELPKVVEELLAKERAEEDRGERDKTRAVTFRAPHNSAVQIYDYRNKKSRYSSNFHLFSFFVESSLDPN